MNSIYHISLVENRFGVLAFEMTDFEDVVKCSTVEGCLNWFGIEPTEENIKFWYSVAAENRRTSVFN